MVQATNTAGSRKGSPGDVPSTLPVLTQLTGDGPSFLADTWGVTAHVHRAFGPEDGLLDLADMDDLISEYGLRSPMVWLMGGGEPTEPAHLRMTTDGTAMVEGLVAPESVSAALLAGRTVSLRGLNHFWPTVGRYCRALEAELSHPVQSNAYLTPAGTPGLALHHDPHDVFVVQTHGEKVWEVYRPRQQNPIAPWNPASDEPGELVGEFRLGVGDCLYIPLGFPHRARTEGRPSLHVTLGVQARRWLDVLEALCAQAAAVPALREPLPPGFAADPERFHERLLSRLQLLTLRASDERIVEGLLDSLAAPRRPALDGHVADVVSLADLAADTPVAWRTDQSCEVVPSADGVVVQLWNRRLTLPGRFVPALDALRAGEPRRVRDLDDRLHAAEALDLVRQLVAAGIVRIQA